MVEELCLWNKRGGLHRPIFEAAVKAQVDPSERKIARGASEIISVISRVKGLGTLVVLESLRE